MKSGRAEMIGMGVIALLFFLEKKGGGNDGTQFATPWPIRLTTKKLPRLGSLNTLKANP